MKLFFYELRKTFLRRYVIVLLLLLSVLDVVKIGVDRYQGNIDLITREGTANQKAFEQFYRNTKGTVTDDTLRFLSEEEQRLGEIYEKRLNYHDPDEVTYSGNLYEDYRILEVYIADEFHYVEGYSDYSNRIAALAQENVSYYQDKGNILKAQENAYIAKNYSSRSIFQFYRTDSVTSYLNIYFSTILIVFMCFLGVAPVFGAEYDCRMNYLLSTSKKGGLKSTFIKILVSICYSCGIVLWFCALDFGTYQVLCGFEGLDNPIWAVKEFKESFLNCSIQNFMIREVLLKLLAVVCITLIILLLSLLLKKILHVAVGFLVFLAGWYAAGSFIFSFSRWKMMLALWNPVTLFNNLKLYRGFHCVEFGNHFILESSICIIGNAVMAALMMVLILLIKRRADKCR